MALAGLMLTQSLVIFRVVTRNYDRIAIINFGYSFDCHKHKICPKV